MSEHNNLTKDEVKALMKHGLPATTPSQLSDSFVFGMRYGKMIGDAVTEGNQRLTAIATKHATRCDELYEALERVCSYLSEDGLIITGLEKEIVNAQTLLRKRAVSDSNDD